MKKRSDTPAWEEEPIPDILAVNIPTLSGQALWVEENEPMLMESENIKPSLGEMLEEEYNKEEEKEAVNQIRRKTYKKRKRSNDYD